MERFFNSSQAQFFFRDIDTRDALQLLCVNRLSSQVFDAHRALLGFALTRPTLNGRAMSLRQWQKVWNMCAEAWDAKADCDDPIMDIGAWAYSVAVYAGRFPENEDGYSLQLANLPGVLLFLKAVIRRMRLGRFGFKLKTRAEVSYILALRASSDMLEFDVMDDRGYDPCDWMQYISDRQNMYSIRTLVLMSDGKCAFIFCDIDYNQSPLQLCVGYRLKKDIISCMGRYASFDREYDSGDLVLALRNPPSGFQHGTEELTDHLRDLMYSADASWFDNEAMRYSLATLLRAASLFDSEELKNNEEPTSTEGVVLQEIIHDEPPATRDESLLACQADEQWTLDVEARLHGIKDSWETAQPETLLFSDADDTQAPDSWTEADSHLERDVWTRCDYASDFGDVIFLVQFTRSGQELRPALHSGRELEEVRNTATSLGKSCSLSSGASIFVFPNQYDSILAVISQYKLRSHHVIIAEAFLPLLYQEIAKLPSRANVRPSSRKPMALIADDEDMPICWVQNTFINAKPRRYEVDIRTQSTSQARKLRNPRAASHSDSL